MSRGLQERVTAWEVWIAIHTEDGHRPVGYFHQCGSVSKLDEDLGSIYCSGCRFELSHPERECEPLYASRRLPSQVS